MLALSYVFYGWVGWSYCLLLVATTTIAFIGGRPSRRSAPKRAPAGGHGPLLRRAAGPARLVQVLRLRLGQPRQPHPRPGARAGRAAPAGGAPHRHLVLHLHGAELRDRHLPAPARAGRPLDLALYLSFFPHLLAGPIVRGTSSCPSCAAGATPGRRLLARPVADHGRALQEGGDLLLRLERHRPAGLHGAGPALGARVDLRRLGLRRADLLRLQRVHRHRHRAGPAARDPLPGQLRRALHGPQPAGLLAALAHHAVALAARLPLHPAGREQRIRGADGPQHHDHHGARGPVARGGVDLRVLGGAARRRAGGGARAPRSRVRRGCRRWPTGRCASGCSGS
jgi:hypothetical protein